MSDLRVTMQQRRIIEERAKRCCEYCRSRLDYTSTLFSIEHIQPRYHGGQTTLDNLALACQECNNRKHIKTTVRDPLDGAIVPLYHPRRHLWREHFTWSSDSLLLIGISPIGRATVAALHLNRPGVVNLRRVLHLIGEHPPPALDDPEEQPAP